MTGVSIIIVAYSIIIFRYGYCALISSVLSSLCRHRTLHRRCHIIVGIPTWGVGRDAIDVKGRELRTSREQEPLGFKLVLWLLSSGLQDQRAVLRLRNLGVRV